MSAENLAILTARRPARRSVDFLVDGDDGVDGGDSSSGEGRRRVTFTFQALGRAELERLIAAHPPREGNADDERAGRNVETFTKALICASLVEPELTPDEFDVVWDHEAWSEADFMAMSIEVAMLNNKAGVAEAGKG